MKKLYGIWILAIAVLVYLSVTYNSTDTIFYGICDSKEMEISLERSVMIDSVYVVTGELVKKGQVLVKLSSKQLEMDIAQKENRISELKVQKMAGTKDINSKIDQLRQEKLIELNEIDQNIKLLQERYDRNVSFAIELKSINLGTKADKKGLIYKEIESLKDTRIFTEKNYNIQIAQLKNAMVKGYDPNQTLIDNIQQELNELLKQKNSLNIYSSINGIIGSVNYKTQSTVAPYTTIMTLSKKSPSYVKGFIHENVYNKVFVGDEVIVKSTAQNYSTTGKIVGVGSRIIEFPERLRKAPELRIWGREVVIKIEETNNFLLGEKVSVSSHSKREPTK